MAFVVDPGTPGAFDHGDQSWLLTSSALVQLMTPGLAFFYGGLVNEGSVVNTMMLSYGCMAVVTLLWGLVGYSLSFDASTNTGVIGLVDLAASKFGNQLRAGTSVSEHAFMIFQLFFAVVTSAIISGAVVQKMRWSWFMAFTAMWHIFVYCPLAHWFFYSNGWMYTYGVMDFAGGLVVHTASGVSAFVLTWWLGRGAPIKHKPHNVPFVLLGAALMWFGWFGFNAGSALKADAVASLAFVNTQYAAAVAMLTWNAMEITFNGTRWFNGVPTAVGAACGAVAGLVGITPACAYVTNMWAFFIGFFTVIPVFFTPRLVELTGADDRLGAFAFHGVGGIVGELLVGLFATDSTGAARNGAFYFNAPQYGKQIAGILVCVFLSVVATTVIYWVLWTLAYLTGSSLVIPLEHQANSDMSQHGENAYGRSATQPAAPAAAKEQPEVVAAPADGKSAHPPTPIVA